MINRVFIHTTWTCTRRKLDARKLATYFIKNNYEIINDPRKADLTILVTCADTNSRSKQSINQVKRFMKYDGELIVAGCLPAIDKEKLEEIFDGKTLITKELEKIDEYFPEHKVKFIDLDDENILWKNKDESKPYGALMKLFWKFKFTHHLYDSIEKYFHKSSIWNSPVFAWYGTAEEKPYFIRPSRGCLGNCTYCAINKAIGRMKSKPLDVCINEFKNGLEKGHKNFIIDADDVGCYGMDGGDGNNNLPEMLRKIIEIPGDYEIDVHYIHPRWLVRYVDELAEILKSGKIRRIGSSIQSGNPHILELMHRFSDTKKAKAAYLKLKEAYPKILLETECIIGFPTETNDEFMDSLRFIEEVRFGWGVFFPFSCKIGTEAEHIEPKVPQREIFRRMNVARKYLKNAGFDVRYARYFKKLSQNILVYSDIKGNMPNLSRTK